MLEIQNLHARAGEAQILNGIDLHIRPGEVHAIMGPNGSGKSTLATTILGSPEYEVTSGALRFNGDDITDGDTDVRAKAGMFLAIVRLKEEGDWAAAAQWAHRGAKAAALALGEDSSTHARFAMLAEAFDKALRV